MTNVLYKLQGSPVTALNRVASVRKTSDWVISYSEPKPKRAVTEPATLQRNGIPPRSRISYTVLNHGIIKSPNNHWIMFKDIYLLTYRPFGLRIQPWPKAKVALVKLIKTWLLKCFRINDLPQFWRHMGCCSVYLPLWSRNTSAIVLSDPYKRLYKNITLNHFALSL